MKRKNSKMTYSTTAYGKMWERIKEKNQKAGKTNEK